MSDGTPPRLEVVSREGQVYIMVPTGRVAALRTYLQGRGLFVSPPQNVSRGVSSVALLKKTDVKVVQAYLDRWAA